MKLEIIDHPARKKNADGELVPLLPDNRAIKADGKVVGYCTAIDGFPITLTFSMTDEEKAEIKAHVEKNLNKVSKVSAPPSPDQIEAVEEYLESGVDPDDDENEEDAEPDNEE